MVRRMAPPRRRGLTPLEWVVVAGIVAILIAILAPVFPKAREPARKPSCQGYLKELANAMSMYVEDWQGCFPVSGVAKDDLTFETKLKKNATAGPATTWAGAIAEFVEHPDAYYCPSDANGRGSSISYYYKHAVNVAARTGFAKEYFAFPAKQVMLYERQPFHWGGGPIADGARINAAFVDGHVQTVGMKDVGPESEPSYFNARTSSGRKAGVRKPYWDPRYCYDKL
ncbi:MAG: DUF1559 domain-containing protein [Armatimonadota bacterium]|nr:DUF1559 domain-containing protein [Armatimonadota bacterium]